MPVDASASDVPERRSRAGSDRVPDDAIVYRSNSLINRLVAAKAGIGLAILPSYRADCEPDLRRLTPPLPELARELWIVTHRDLKETARVRTFMEAVGERIRRQFQAAEAGTR